ncbi:MAG: hypothetical protein RLZZ379_284, partial [Pseudomonadota bacterium]
TMGQPELKEVLIARPEFSRVDVLSLAASIEAGQKHPLALSILRAAEAENCAPTVLPEVVANQLGKGLSSGVYRLGSAAWTGAQQIAQEGQYGQVHLADDKGVIASFLFLDTPRAGLEKLLVAGTGFEPVTFGL